MKSCIYFADHSFGLKVLKALSWFRFEILCYNKVKWEGLKSLSVFPEQEAETEMECLELE